MNTERNEHDTAFVNKNDYLLTSASEMAENHFL